MRALVALVLSVGITTDAAAQRRPVVIDDQFRVQDVGSPELSPDGEWVVYTVTTTDVAADKRNSDVWKVKWDGSERSQLTFSPENESAPKWSPDGKYISFLSSRPGPARGNQVWLLERSGGEARQLTQFKGGVTSYEWSPDGKRLALVRRHGGDEGAADAGDDRANAAAASRPIVIDSYQFKRDGQTYLTGNARTRISIFDLATRKEELLTSDAQRQRRHSTRADQPGRQMARASRLSAITTRTGIAPATTTSSSSTRRRDRSRGSSRRSSAKTVAAAMTA